MTSFAALLALLPDWLDPIKIVEGDTGWVEIIILLIIFAECGLLIGFFLPGDSLLFVAGFFSAKGDLWPWYFLLPALFAAAFLGDQVGYQFGRRIGPTLFHREDSRFFKQSNVVKAHDYFERRGQPAIVLARFVPVVRTFLPVVVGVSEYEYRKFLPANALGGLLWAVGVTTAGIITFHLVGEVVNVDKYIYPVVAVVIVLSFVPVFLEVMRARRHTGDAKF